MYFLLECYSNTYSILFKMPCGFCHRTGHNRLTCPAFQAVRERDGQQRHLIQLMDSQREIMIEQLEQERNVIRNTSLIIHNIMNRSEYNIRKKNNHDEGRINEIMERQMLVQSSQNPFLNKNFVDVLIDQEKYLIPQNSQVEKD